MFPHMIIFYRSEGALDEYLKGFCGTLKHAKVRKSSTGRTYTGDHFLIDCIKGIPDSSRGQKAQIISVQEDLTWCDDWPELLETMIRPMLFSPIDVQIFDGERYEIAASREQFREAMERDTRV